MSKYGEPWKTLPENGELIVTTSIDEYITDFTSPKFGIEGNKELCNRVIDCVNAMEGIEDPKKFRETWEVIKHLELDAFVSLKEKYDELFEICIEIKSYLDKNPKNYMGSGSILHQNLSEALLSK